MSTSPVAIEHPLPPAQLLVCPRCHRLYGEMTRDGNRLAAPGGWTEYRYHCHCLWCGHIWLWVPSREQRHKP